jgi:hypothetical protein
MKPDDGLRLAGEGIKYLGSIGGLIYIVNLIILFVNRVRVEIRDVQDYSRDNITIRFEAENLGSSPTSIHTIVNLRCYLPRPRDKKKDHHWKLKLEKYEFDLKLLENTERSLLPSSPKIFYADKEIYNSALLERIGFTFFRTYTFSFTHGRRRRVRIRSASGVQIGMIRYHFEVMLFRLFGARFLPRDDRSDEVTQALS